MKPDTVMDAWIKGLATGAALMPLAENPYSAGTMLHATWVKGWSAGPGLRGQQSSKRAGQTYAAQPELLTAPVSPACLGRDHLAGPAGSEPRPE